MHSEILTTIGIPLTGYMALLPAGFLLIALFWGLFADYLPGKDRGASVAGFVCATAAAVSAALISPGTLLFGGRFFYAYEARFATVVICILAALWCLWTLGSGTGRTREAIALAMASSVGAIFAVAATDLIVLLLALELAAMPGYVLIGYRRYRMRGLEAALKYFLLSVLATLIMIYGMTFLVGLSGNTTFTALAQLTESSLVLIAFGLVLLGLFAKLSVAPFHWWAPDAYEGAEPWALAFASIIPKVAVTIVIVRFVFIMSASVALGQIVIMLMAIISLVVGSFAALRQTDTRRLLAYSGVAGGGYVLIALTVVSMGGPTSSEAFYAAIFYTVAYVLSMMGALLIAAHEGGRISDLNGLSTRNPFMAWALVGFTLSMIGVPPLVGFFAKLNLFLVAVAAGLVPLVVFAVVMAVVSAFFYLRLVRAAFFGEPDQTPEPAITAEMPETPDTTDTAEGSVFSPVPISSDSPDTTAAAEKPYGEKSPYSVASYIVIGTLVLAVLIMGILYQPVMNILTG